MKKKLSRYSTINTIKNCHKSQHNGENHKFYTHSGEFQLPIYFRQKPTPKINKGTNNETLVYKEKKLMEISKYDRNLYANSRNLKCWIVVIG